ncbi:LysR family transcriptional regulator substrate-binding protein [Tsukamurella soli]|uniref:LysR family transcriptional regulator substrate-binding protein n=1 Tax=Tsukamurella soli TaxID=644556 RepID=UPI003612F575
MGRRERSERAESVGRRERSERAESVGRRERSERAESVGRRERSERAESVGRRERSERAESVGRRERSERAESVPRVDPAALGELDWISVRDGFPVDDVLRSFATITGVQPRIVQRINDFHTMQAMVAAGLGVALVARHAVTHPGVVGIEIADVRAARIVEVATRPGAHRRPAIAAVLSALDAAVAALGP